MVALDQQVIIADRHMHRGRGNRRAVLGLDHGQRTVVRKHLAQAAHITRAHVHADHDRKLGIAVQRLEQGTDDRQTSGRAADGKRLEGATIHAASRLSR
jgi:hypothetical protein